MKKRLTALLFTLAALCAGVAAQQTGLATDFTTEGGTPLVTRGDYVLRGTVLVQYQGKADEVIIPADLGITEIREGAFGKATLRSVVIPEGVTKLAPRVFNDCYNLATVTLPRSLTDIGENVFSECGSLTAIRVDGANPRYAERNGVLFNKTITHLIRYPAAKTETDYTVPAGVATVEVNAFSGSKNLKFITLPAGLAVIGDWAFARCSGLESITLPVGLISIGDSAFWGCYGLNFISLPASLTSIGGSAFSGCSGLTTISLPAGLTSIGNYAFQYCSSMTAINLPAPEPPALNGSLWYSWSRAPAIIYVPAASVDAYKNAAGWKNHADRIEAAGE